MSEDLESRRDPVTHVIPVALEGRLEMDPGCDPTWITVRAEGGKIGWVQQCANGRWLPTRTTGRSTEQTYSSPDRAALALWIDRIGMPF